jgi:superfamily II DNA or RNA helicase
MVDLPETPEERRRRLGQTKFGGQETGPRQSRLFPEERTFGGEVYLPPSEVERRRREQRVERLNPPGPRVTEYGEEGRPRPVSVPVPAPPVPGGYVVPQRTFESGTAETETPTQFVVRPIPMEITRGWRPPFQLRPAQVEAIRQFHLRHKGRVVFPTGVGKTEIAIGALNDLRVPTVIIEPTNVLVEQWVKRLATWGIQAGVWNGERHEPSYVTVSTYQSLYSDPALIRRFSFIIFDEAHHATSEEFATLIRETLVHPYALALTATDPSDTARRDLLDRYLPLVATMTTGEAIEQGLLTPVEPIPVPTPLNAEERARYDQITKVLTFRAQRMGTGNPYKVRRLLGSLQYGQDAVAFLRALSARRKLLSEVKSKNAALLEVVRRNPHQRILLLSESVPAVTAMCEQLRGQGVGCHVISGETDARTRRLILETWGKTFYVLGSVHVLQEGVDVPEVGIAVIVASGTGKLQLTQRLGRILRLSPGKAKAYVYVLYAPDTTETEIYAKVRRLAGQSVPTPGAPKLDEFDDDDR